MAGCGGHAVQGLLLGLIGLTVVMPPIAFKSVRCGDSTVAPVTTPAICESPTPSACDLSGMPRPMGARRASTRGGTCVSSALVPPTTDREDYRNRGRPVLAASPAGVPLSAAIAATP